MKTLSFLLFALIICIHTNGQFIIAGDSTESNILFTKLDTLIQANVPSSHGVWLMQFYLDVNQDGINDYLFECGSSNDALGETAVYSDVKSLNDNFVCVDSLPVSSSSNVIPLNYGDTINGERLWYSGPQSLCLAGYFSTYPPCGIWKDLPTSYIGLKVKINGNYYYAWIKVNVSYSGNTVYLNLISCAIINTPEGINDHLSADGLIIYPNPVVGKLIIEQTLREKGNISIFDNTSQLIASQEINSNRTEIDFNGFTSGIYYLKFYNEHTVVVKKIIKK